MQLLNPPAEPPPAAEPGEAAASAQASPARDGQGSGDRAAAARKAAAAILYIVALLLLLLCLMPPDGVLSDNEENYFALAASSDPASPYTAIYDASRHRLVADWLLGGVIAALGFERTQIVTHGLAAVAYALLLCALFRRFGLSALDAVLVILVFALLGQTLMGGEWLFGGFEAKVVAYFCVLAGLYRAASHRPLTGAALLFAAATYFHFLVGGFWFAAAMAARLIEDRRDVRNVAGATLRYALMVAPLVAVIAGTRYVEARGFVQPPDVPSPDFIYSIVREPWHGAPFLSWHNFRTQWLPGAVAAAVMLIACLVVALRQGGRRWRATALWLAALLAYLLVALAASYVERDTGTLGKFYLFRPASLLLLLWLAFATAWFSALGLRRWTVVRLAALAVLLPLFALGTAERLAGDRERAALAGEKRALAGALAENAAPKSVVLIDPQIEWSFLDFERLTGHPTLVMFKFMPTDNSGIVEWYRRMEFRRVVFAQGCPRQPAYPIDYLLTTPDRAPVLVGSCGEAIYATDRFALWRVAR